MHQRRQFSYNGVLNVIPPSRLSKVAQSFQSYLPTPTNNNINLNYLAVLPNLVNNDSGTLKMDYAVNEKHHLMGIFTRGRYANPVTGSLAIPTATTNAALPVPYLDGRGVIEYSTLAQVHESWVISPNVINDFGYGGEPSVRSPDQQYGQRKLPVEGRIDRIAPGQSPARASRMSRLPEPRFLFPGVGLNSHVTVEAQTSYTAQDNLPLD